MSLFLYTGRLSPEDYGNFPRCHKYAHYTQPDASSIQLLLRSTGNMQWLLHSHAIEIKLKREESWHEKRWWTSDFSENIFLWQCSQNMRPCKLLEPLSGPLVGNYTSEGAWNLDLSFLSFAIHLPLSSSLAQLLLLQYYYYYYYYCNFKIYIELGTQQTVSWFCVSASWSPPDLQKAS